MLMVATSYIRGHKVFFNENENKWLFCDEQSNNNFVEVCPRCCQPHLPNDCDYCLRPLQKCDYIVSACCGHGVEQGYIQLADGRIFKEEKVIDDERKQ